MTAERREQLEKLAQGKNGGIAIMKGEEELEVFMEACMAEELRRAYLDRAYHSDWGWGWD